MPARGRSCELEEKAEAPQDAEGRLDAARGWLGHWAQEAQQLSRELRRLRAAHTALRGAARGLREFAARRAAAGGNDAAEAAAAVAAAAAADAAADAEGSRGGADPDGGAGCDGAGAWGESECGVQDSSVWEREWPGFRGRFCSAVRTVL